MDGASEGQLNAAQARAVLATFTHVSRLLDDVLQVAGTDPAGLDRWRSDLSQVDARRLLALMPEIRDRMMASLDTLGISAPERDTSARWIAQTSLLYADIALSELNADGLRRYGAMDEEASRAVAEVARELREMISSAQEILRRAAPTG